MDRAEVPPPWPFPDRAKETAFLLRQTRRIPPTGLIYFDALEASRWRPLAPLFERRIAIGGRRARPPLVHGRRAGFPGNRLFQRFETSDQFGHSDRFRQIRQ